MMKKQAEGTSMEEKAIGMTASALVAVKLILWGCAAWQAIHLQWLGVVGLILVGEFFGFMGRRSFEKYEEEVKKLP